MAGAVVLSLIVVAASFTLSFNALADLARMSGAIPDSLTSLLPVVIDVFILQATWCVYVATRRGDDAGKRYHFAMLAIFSTVSVAATPRTPSSPPDKAPCTDSWRSRSQ
ncbi:DUF2637 domain-containing protein (plasmid) [Gordonia amicalis]|nr:DUF2637 domain-containing protein [Gordonia amicalis]